MHAMRCGCSRCSPNRAPLFEAGYEAEYEAEHETEHEDAFELEFSFVGFPPPVLDALRVGDERTAVRRAAAAGFADENTLTDLVFHNRHRERNGAPLRADEPGYAGLAAEWLGIRDQLVRGTPRAPMGAAPSPTTPAPSPGAGTTQDIVTVRGIQVARQIAGQVNGLLAAAAADGVPLTGGGWRSPDQQIALRKQNCGNSPFDIYEKPSSQCTPQTARPGTSNHERGLAIDFAYAGSANDKFANTPGHAWMQRNARRFGLYNLPSEPWHWSVDGG